MRWDRVDRGILNGSVEEMLRDFKRVAQSIDHQYQHARPFWPFFVQSDQPQPCLESFLSWGFFRIPSHTSQGHRNDETEHGWSRENAFLGLLSHMVWWQRSFLVVCRGLLSGWHVRHAHTRTHNIYIYISICLCVYVQIHFCIAQYVILCNTPNTQYIFTLVQWKHAWHWILRHNLFA